MLFLHGAVAPRISGVGPRPAWLDRAVKRLRDVRTAPGGHSELAREVGVSREHLACTATGGRTCGTIGARVDGSMTGRALFGGIVRATAGGRQEEGP